MNQHSGQQRHNVDPNQRRDGSLPPYQSVALGIFAEADPRRLGVSRGVLKKYFREQRGMLQRVMGGEMEWARLLKELEKLGSDEHGRVEKEEFVAFYMSRMVGGAYEALGNADGVGGYNADGVGGYSARQEREELPSLSDVQPEWLEEYLTKLFHIADANHDGVLQRDELETLLRMSGFELDPKTINNLMAAADVNQDGVIDYQEFIQVAIGILIGGCEDLAIGGCEDLAGSGQQQVDGARGDDSEGSDRRREREKSRGQDEVNDANDEGSDAKDEGSDVKPTGSVRGRSRLGRSRGVVPDALRDVRRVLLSRSQSPFRSPSRQTDLDVERRLPISGSRGAPISGTNRSSSPGRRDGRNEDSLSRRDGSAGGGLEEVVPDLLKAFDLIDSEGTGFAPRVDLRCKVTRYERAG